MAMTGKIVSVHVGAEGTLEKAGCDRIELALDGIVGDRHRGLSREAWEGDKQPAGTERRNERMWSAVSLEELADIRETMDLVDPLTAATLGANICLSGIPDFSRLPRGTVLSFDSGVVLMVEEYNPPCSDMGATIAELHQTREGHSIVPTAFSEAAKFLRGVVGVVEVPGFIRVGDTVTVTAEHLPRWLRR